MSLCTSLQSSYPTYFTLWEQKTAPTTLATFTLSGTKSDSEAYDTMFDILKIYETQTDIVEELLHKKVVYNKAYRENLTRDFSKLFPDPALIQRLIIGNYDLPEDVHKRPTAKFVQDIAVDIRLIKKTR